MRTTLDLDPVVLAAARARAQAHKISLGAAVSSLALEALEKQAVPTSTELGLPVLAGVPEHLVTDDLVAKYRDD